MIGGYPHRQEDSFFHLAIARLQAGTDHHISESLFTMGGFPITRVPKHFQARCLAARPNIVVLQFGASDLTVPLRRHHPQSGQPIHASVSTQAPTWLDRKKWWVRSRIGDALNRKSVTPPETYLATLTQLTRTLLEHQIIPVVISPFVFGGRRSDRLACDCTRRLQEILAALPGAVYVDAYAALDRHPRRRMLRRDGSHLSLEGQRVVADELFSALKGLLGQGAWAATNGSVRSV